MGWDQKIEYVDAVEVPRPPVKKQIWDGKQFVPMTLWRTSKKLTYDQIDWLRATYGACDVYAPSIQGLAVPLGAPVRVKNLIN